MADKDYSATPLWKKLGLKEGARFGMLGPPDGFGMGLPGGVRMFTKLAGRFDVILQFATREAKLKRDFSRAKSYLEPAGGLWIAYPKKTSAIATNLTFDNVQRVGLDAGLVDNKSCAITEVWSGLRFVVRVADRAAWPVPPGKGRG
jgi:hypothetical protein